MPDPAPTPRGYWGPDYRDIYLLIVGIIVGTLLSGAVLGKLNRPLYERTFIGGLEEAQHLKDFEAQVEREAAELDRKSDDQIEQLKQSGATPVAVEEQEAKAERAATQRGEHNVNMRHALDEMYLQARDRHALILGGYLTALILAVLAIMVLEALIDPLAAAPWPRLRSRLASVRYALLAAWIALVVAQPQPLVPVPYQLVGLLILVALLAAWVPLGRRVP